MDRGRLRGVQRPRVAHPQIDIGSEPPLLADGASGDVGNRRRISVRWFTALLLVGLCGAALLSGAVFTSFDGEISFAAGPERLDGVVRTAAAGAERAASRKGDRLPTYTEPSVTRQVFRVSTTMQVGNREIVRVRPYVRVVGNLSLSVGELSAQIPPFNPQRILAEAASEAGTAAASPAAEPDAAVSFITRDLAELLPRASLAAVMEPEQILAQVRQSVNWTVRAGGAGTASFPGRPLAYATTGPSSDPYAGFEARIVPENVTLLPKTHMEANGGSPWTERVVMAKAGDTIQSVVRELGASAEEAKSIARVLTSLGVADKLREGQKLRVLLAPSRGDREFVPIRVVVYGEDTIEAGVAMSDSGRFVAVHIDTSESELADVQREEDEEGAAVRLYQSIYATALRDQVPRSVIEDLVRIYSYDTDYQRRVQPGDSLQLLYAGDDETPGNDGNAELVFAELTVGGDSRRFYRFQTPDDGAVDFYDETGKSARRFLIRKPLADGRFMSSFGMRRHPLLGRRLMHTGVDWAAPHGTPILAAGNGVIEKAAWESGYGRYLRIRHLNGYETAYAHMSGFARGIKEGVRVRQGQVIGFVGSTGLSTGPHLHYEILVNGRFVDPTRVRLPRGRSLEGPLLARFEEERERIDAIKSRPALRTAQSLGSR